MTRGTTPTIVLELPESIPADEISAAVLSIGQDGVEIVKKPFTDMTVSGNTVTAVLTQAETMLLSDNRNAEIQFKCKIGGDVIVSETETVDVSVLINSDIL